MKRIDSLEKTLKMGKIEGRRRNVLCSAPAMKTSDNVSPFHFYSAAQKTVFLGLSQLHIYIFFRFHSDLICVASLGLRGVNEVGGQVTSRAVTLPKAITITKCSCFPFSMILYFVSLV